MISWSVFPCCCSRLVRRAMRGRLSPTCPFLVPNRYGSPGYTYESDFVDTVLCRAEERYERRYELKRRGYDFDNRTGLLKS